MITDLINGLFVILLWIGLWGLTEMIIDRFVGNNKQLRFIVYVLMFIVAILLLWIYNFNI